MCEAVAAAVVVVVVGGGVTDEYYCLQSPIRTHNRGRDTVTIAREEGLSALYKGVVPTVLRQASNQGVNFTFYNIFKRQWLKYSERQELLPYQHLMIGGLSGGMVRHFASYVVSLSSLSFLMAPSRLAGVARRVLAATVRWTW